MLGDPAALPTSGKGVPNVNALKHPQYTLLQDQWEAWRLCYLGGSRFIKRYLKKFSLREDDVSFRERRDISYCPAFAKAAINEVKNSIFQRFSDVSREGGAHSYQAAIAGRLGGVDRLGATMNTFIGRDILPELLTMARVGVYVDMPPIDSGTTIADRGGKRPYVYFYRAEDIRSWAFHDGPTGNPTDFKALLLRDSSYDMDAHWVLPYEVTSRYRYVWVDDSDGLVHVQFYNQLGDSSYTGGYEPGEEHILPLTRIPFVLIELSDSLLTDVAQYQVALLNLASSDVSYALKSNYAFYTEQYDPRSEAVHLKQANTYGNVQSTLDPTNGPIIVNQDKVHEIQAGSTSGRRYPIGAERPAFINPSSEPLQASMAKQKQLQEEIRQLVHLSVANLQPARQSADAMALGNHGLESGLAYIGVALEHAERQIAEYWSIYEGSEPATIHYPEQYSLLSEDDRRAQAGALQQLMPMVPSLTFRREVSKRIADIVLGTKISSAALRKIKSEIDSDPVVLGDPAVIETDVVNGLVDLETASAARGYPKGCVEKAAVEHAERLARIAAAQTPPGAPSSDMGARGVSDQSASPKAGVEEKAASQKDQTTRDKVKPRTRGEAKSATTQVEPD